MRASHGKAALMARDSTRRPAQGKVKDSQGPQEEHEHFNLGRSTVPPALFDALDDPEQNRMLRYGMKYVDQGAKIYEAQHRQRQIGQLKWNAAKLGFRVVEVAA